MSHLYNGIPHAWKDNLYTETTHLSQPLFFPQLTLVCIIQSLFHFLQQRTGLSPAMMQQFFQHQFPRIPIQQLGGVDEVRVAGKQQYRSDISGVLCLPSTARSAYTEAVLQ